MAERIDYIAEAITEAFGSRCPDFAEGCACCEAWQQYDRLMAAIKCPIGLDDVSEICSAGSCLTCITRRYEHYYDAAKKAEAALSASPASAQIDEWRSMDSAPKDGTEFDVWCITPEGYSGVRFTDVCMRGDDSGWGFVHHYPDEEGKVQAHWEYLEINGVFPAWRPVAWRPRPAAPSLRESLPTAEGETNG